MTVPSDMDEFAEAVGRSPFHQWLEMDVVAFDRASSRLRLGLDVRGDFLRVAGGGGLHGGIIASLIDIAAAYAVERFVSPGGATVTLSVDYLRPIFGERVEAEAAIVRAGRSQVWSDVELFEGDKLSAIGRARFAMARAA